MKAATICRAGRDLEFHQLADAVHLAGDSSAWLQREAATLGVEPPEASPTRGVWGADGMFHPHGVALCDWWNSMSNQARRGTFCSRTGGRCGWGKMVSSCTLAAVLRCACGECNVCRGKL